MRPPNIFNFHFHFSAQCNITLSGGQINLSVGCKNYEQCMVYHKNGMHNDCTYNIPCLHCTVAAAKTSSYYDLHCHPCHCVLCVVHCAVCSAVVKWKLFYILSLLLMLSYGHCCCCCYFQIGHFCAFVPQFGSMIHKTQDEPLSLMMSQFVSEFIS